MYKEWPQSALEWHSWPTIAAKQDLILMEDQNLLFRGPRLERMHQYIIMGIAVIAMTSEKHLIMTSFPHPQMSMP